MKWNLPAMGKKIPVPYGSLQTSFTVRLLVQKVSVTKVPKIHFLTYMGTGFEELHVKIPWTS